MVQGYVKDARWHDENGWNEEKITRVIKEKMDELHIHHFPSQVELRNNGSSNLASVINRTGGFLYWKDKMGLSESPCHSEVGWHGESIVAEKLTELGFKFQKESVTCRFDFTVGDFVRVDSKYAHIYHSKNGDFYSFNLKGNWRDCDIFIGVCEDEEQNRKFYVIPHVVVFNQTQISLGIKNTKWSRFENRFDLIEKYDKFYKKIKEEE